MDRPSADEWVSVGKIERTFGVRGEVRVRSLSDIPGRVEGLESVRVQSLTGEKIDTRVTSVREAERGYILHLEAFSSPEEAAVFRGGFIQIPPDQVAPLPPDQFYEFDLLGMTVTEESGTIFGTVEELFETGAYHLLVVRGPSGERLLPMVKAVVLSVDLEARLITVRWPHMESDLRHAV